MTCPFKLITGLPLEPGETYTLSAHIRTRDVVSDDAAIFLIDEGWRNNYGRLDTPQGNSEGVVR